jgi:hypothetical protein
MNEEVNQSNLRDDDDEIDEDDDDEIDEYEDDPNRCYNCGTALDPDEIERYENDLCEWARKHPGADDRTLESDAIFEVQRNCHRCEVERLRLQKRIEEKTTFIERAAAGGNEAWIVVIIGILVLLVIALAGR